MTPDQRRAARERCEKATKGPWRTGDGDTGRIVCAEHEWICGCIYNANAFDDADFIAHARTDLPAALEEIERLQKENAELSAMNAEKAKAVDDLAAIVFKRQEPRDDR